MLRKFCFLLTSLAALSFAGCSSSTSGNSGGGSGGGSSSSPQLSVSANALTFTATTIGQSSAAQVITLSNTGNAALTLTTPVLSDTTDYGMVSTCGMSLALNASCALTVTLTPKSASTLSATISFTDSASISPVVIILSGTGVKSTLSVSSTGIGFSSTTVGQSSSAQVVTLTNVGTTALTLTTPVLSDTTDYAMVSTCLASLAVNANCTLNLTFTPKSAATLSATVTFTSSASATPVSITLTGVGASSSSPITSAYTLYTFPETDLSVTPLYALVSAAAKTIDMTMYELVDTTFSADLVAACARGVKVRVILDASLEMSSNTPAYSQLNSAGSNCSAAWSNTQFQATHQKTMTIDGTTTVIMSLNLTSRYYNTTRDFALVETDPVDIAAIETTFNTDYGSTSDYSYVPPNGDSLIWSPTTAQADLLAIINGATRTLLVENEEMSATNIVSALQAACQRGVTVQIAMTDTGSYHANFTALEASGCGVHTYPDTATALYIHAKALVADYGLKTQAVYMGSINFSTASMTENRELGAYITDPASVLALYTTITADYAGASAF